MCLVHSDECISIEYRETRHSVNNIQLEIWICHMTLIRILWGIAVNAVKRRKTSATKLSGFSFLHFLMRVLRDFETS